MNMEWIVLEQAAAKSSSNATYHQNNFFISAFIGRINFLPAGGRKKLRYRATLVRIRKVAPAVCQ
jgi:hypothetical protein